jgi:hypothetical protein
MEAGLAIYEAAKKEFGDENVRHDKYVQKGIRQRFVRKRDFRFRAIISIQVLALLAEEYDQAEACNSRNG